MCKVRIPGEVISVGILLKKSQSPIIDCFTIYITNVATMELLRNLFEGYPNLWGGGVAHSVLVLSLVIAFGIILGKVKVAGISLGVTWILFAYEFSIFVVNVVVLTQLCLSPVLD